MALPKARSAFPYSAFSSFAFDLLVMALQSIGLGRDPSDAAPAAASAAAPGPSFAAPPAAAAASAPALCPFASIPSLPPPSFLLPPAARAVVFGSLCVPPTVLSSAAPPVAANNAATMLPTAAVGTVVILSVAIDKGPSRKRARSITLTLHRKN